MKKGMYCMKKLLLTTAAVATFIGGSAIAETMTKEQVEAIIKDYIQNNPNVILDSVEAYGNSQYEAEKAAQQAAVTEHLDWLENNDMLPMAGNPDGDVTVVEFFDYNCGYCKKALDDVTILIDDDKNVKFVFVDMPILGQTSETAARWSLAAQKQDAYLEYHIALMKHRGMVNEAALRKIGEKIDLDVKQLEADANSKDVKKRIQEKTEKAAKMGISGTPAFVIGGQLYGGYIGLDRMKAAVAEAREG